jgi:hypothetical protein
MCPVAEILEFSHEIDRLGRGHAFKEKPGADCSDIHAATSNPTGLSVQEKKEAGGFSSGRESVKSAHFC